MKKENDDYMENVPMITPMNPSGETNMNSISNSISVYELEERIVITAPMTLPKCEIFGTRYHDADYYRHHEIFRNYMTRKQYSYIGRIAKRYAKLLVLPKPLWLIAIEHFADSLMQLVFIETYHKIKQGKPISKRLEREKKVIELYKKGLSLWQIAKIVKTCPSNVHRILRKYGLK